MNGMKVKPPAMYTRINVRRLSITHLGPLEVGMEEESQTALRRPKHVMIWPCPVWDFTFPGEVLRYAATDKDILL